jgi:hypothetical protein
MGSPRYPTEEQVKKINAATALPAPLQQHLEGNRLDVDLPVNALVLVEVQTALPKTNRP